jgi:hypothetical protein
MLRVDNNAQIVRLPWTITGMFSGRYAIQSGKRIFAVRWKKAQIENVIADQKDEPVSMLSDRRRTLPVP